jgi:hypothetical protein
MDPEPDIRIRRKQSAGAPSAQRQFTRRAFPVSLWTSRSPSVVRISRYVQFCHGTVPIENGVLTNTDKTSLETNPPVTVIFLPISNHHRHRYCKYAQQGRATFALPKFIFHEIGGLSLIYFTWQRRLRPEAEPRGCGLDSLAH